LRACGGSGATVGAGACVCGEGTTTGGGTGARGRAGGDTGSDGGAGIGADAGGVGAGLGDSVLTIGAAGASVLLDGAVAHPDMTKAVAIRHAGIKREVNVISFFRHSRVAGLFIGWSDIHQLIILQHYYACGITRHLHIIPYLCDARSMQHFAIPNIRSGPHAWPSAIICPAVLRFQKNCLHVEGSHANA
jgi:hypothetical protein